MRTILHHGPIFLLLLAITFAAFGYLTTAPLWDHTDYEILVDALGQSQELGTMVQHIGFYFSQPLLQLAFVLELNLFGLDPAGYLAVNLFLHACNSFLVYMLVNMLFPRKRMALLSALLFALGVGNYGKTLMAIHQLESLLLALLHLLVLYFFIRNDFRREGRIFSPLFLLGLTLFLATGLTKTASFSLIGTLIAYKAFFYKWRKGRAVFSADILTFVVVGMFFYWAQSRWGYQFHRIIGSQSPFESFTLVSLKNIFRYLNLMFFPIQASAALDASNALIHAVYEARTVIRTFLTLSIVSFSFFGFVFGSKAIRFFIAWTYITLLPFTGNTESGSWLNLNHLYLTSLGFCVVLAAGATGCSDLLRIRRWRRFVPYGIPLLFVLLSVGLTYKLDSEHRAFARSEAGQEMHRTLDEQFARTQIDRTHTLRRNPRGIAGVPRSLRYLWRMVHDAARRQPA